MKPWYADESVTLHLGDALEVLRTMPDESVNCCVTSPPYYALRDYGVPGQYGLEATPAAYVATMAAVFAEVRRVLTKDGTLWINIGDSYNAYNGNRGVSRTGFSRNDPLPALSSGHGLTVKGLPAKNLLGIPWRVAFALQDDGWILRNEIIWHKPNAMPESVTDRLAGRHETVFMLTKSARYWFDLDIIREPHAESTRAAVHRARPTYKAPGQTTNMKTRTANENGANPGDVWSINTTPFAAAHFAMMPAALAERCVLAGCRPGGTVLDPFCGSGTTGLVAGKHGRRFVGIDLSEDYLRLALRTRLAQGCLPLPPQDAPSAVEARRVGDGTR